MSYTNERDQFIVEATRAGLTLDQAARLLRCATTLQRLAEAQCNGDWPADNGERKVSACPVCESCWVPSQITGGARAVAAWKRRAVDGAGPGPACPDCRTESIVLELLEGSQLMPVFGGDPRGYVLKLYEKTTTHEDRESGRARSIGVPTR